MLGRRRLPYCHRPFTLLCFQSTASQRYRWSPDPHIALCQQHPLAFASQFALAPAHTRSLTASYRNSLSLTAILIPPVQSPPWSAYTPRRPSKSHSNTLIQNLFTDGRFLQHFFASIPPRVAFSYVHCSRVLSWRRTHMVSFFLSDARSFRFVFGHPIPPSLYRRIHCFSPFLLRFPCFCSIIVVTLALYLFICCSSYRYPLFSLFCLFSYIQVCSHTFSDFHIPVALYPLCIVCRQTHYQYHCQLNGWLTGRTSAMLSEFTFHFSEVQMPLQRIYFC